MRDCGGCRVNSPLVTVGIPFFNVRRWLANAIRSVFAQSFSDWEMVLLDDGSTDGSAEIALAIDDPRVRVHLGRENLKVAVRRNEVVQLARGKYLAWLDGDDLMHPERLQKEVRFLEENRDVDVVGAGMYVVDQEGNAIGKRLPRADGKLSCRPCDLPLMQGTVMGKLEWFRRNPYDPGLARVQDMDLWLRTAPYSRFANLHKPLYFYTEFETFSFRRYRVACSFVRKVIKRHGPRIVGPFNTRMEILKTYVKVGVYAAACCCGAERMLLRRRSEPLSAVEKAEAQMILDRIRKQELPLRAPLRLVSEGA
jgi:glycosyltransferase involved in cell wall biosynthesis